MHKEKKTEGGERDGDIDGSNWPKSSVKGVENEWSKWRTIALVRREDEQSEDFARGTPKRFLNTFFPSTLTHHHYMQKHSCFMTRL